MPYRSPTIETNEFYHIFNRSIAYEKIFNTIAHKNLYLNMMHYYKHNTITPYSFIKYFSETTRNELDGLTASQVDPVEIVAFAIMPTHFHLLLKQKSDGGISRYLRRLENAYAKAYNRHRDRHGGVFAGRFGSVKISSKIQLYRTSRYIHVNPIKAKIIPMISLDKYPYTSFASYMKPSPLLQAGYVLKGFHDAQEYREYVMSGYNDELPYLNGEY